MDVSKRTEVPTTCESSVKCGRREEIESSGDFLVVFCFWIHSSYGKTNFCFFVLTDDYLVGGSSGVVNSWRRGGCRILA